MQSTEKEIFLILFTIILQTLMVDQAIAQEEASVDTRVGLYFNYYFERYTNTLFDPQRLHLPARLSNRDRDSKTDLFKDMA